MTTRDGRDARREARDEEDFRRKDQALIEKIRQRSAGAEIQHALGVTTGIDDLEILHELQALGFTPETVALLPLIPVLQVAWAEGGVTPAERQLVETFATARGIAPGSAADAQLMDWLANEPADEVFVGAARLVRALLGTGSTVVDPRDADDLIDYCEQVAAASGGVFGLGRVSEDEKTLLRSIATDLRDRRG